MHTLTAKPAHYGCALILLFCLGVLPTLVHANQRRPPAGGPRAIVVDERLAALRAAPQLDAPLVQRLGRGRNVALLGPRRNADGVQFYQVAVTRRTRGWVQAECLIAPTRAGDDARLLRLVQGSTGFDRLARARLFLVEFPRSPLRPAVLLLYGVAAEEAAARLSHEAGRRLDAGEMAAGGAPVHSYFLNYNGLDRYQRQGITFVFDRAARSYHYDGASWRELVRRYPRSAEAAEAGRWLAALAARPGP